MEGAEHSRRFCRRSAAKKPDYRFRLLRSRGDRPGRCTNEELHELSPPRHKSHLAQLRRIATDMLINFRRLTGSPVYPESTLVARTTVDGSGSEPVIATISRELF